MNGKERDGLGMEARLAAGRAGGLRRADVAAGRGASAGLAMTAYSDGQWGTSDAPGNCPDCGAAWANSERLHTGDDRGIGGWEDWMHCQACGCQMFYPVTRSDEPPNR